MRVVATASMGATRAEVHAQSPGLRSAPAIGASDLPRPTLGASPQVQVLLQQPALQPPPFAGEVVLKSACDGSIASAELRNSVIRADCSRDDSKLATAVVTE